MSHSFRALGLFSGGLDSILACLLLRRLNIEIEAITYVSSFFGAKYAEAAAEEYSIPLTILEVGSDYLDDIIKRPYYGYGSNMNPCIDCRIYMLINAGKIMEIRKLDFIFTGEVLGQRSMSQTRQALVRVAEKSGYASRLLRPLSAKLLPITVMEKIGIVNRDKLLAWSGRSRKSQISLASVLGILNYPSPAGGCLLTDPGFSRRLKDLFSYNLRTILFEVEILKYGRHLRFNSRVKLVIGRNYSENQILIKLALENNKQILRIVNQGIIGVYFGPLNDSVFKLALAAFASYSKVLSYRSIIIQIDKKFELVIIPLDRQQVQNYLL